MEHFQNFLKSITLKKFIFGFVGLLTIVSILGFNILNSKPDSKSYVYAEGLNQDEYDLKITDILETANPNSQIYKQDKIHSNIKTFDKRVFVLDQYFLKNKSPLYGFANEFVQACEHYGAPEDCTVIAAIAKNESALCKYGISAEMFNCWGFGGPAEYRRKFNSFRDGVTTVTDVLVNQYGIKYMNNPSLMERTFCGDEPGCENWGDKIKSFMKEIDDFSKSIGMGSLLELRK